MTLDDAMTLTAKILAVGLIIGSLEWIALLYNLESLTSGKQIVAPALSEHLGLGRTVAIAQALGATLLLTSTSSNLTLLTLCALLATSMLFMFLPYTGVEISDYLNVLVIASLGLYALQPFNIPRMVSAITIAVATVSSYFVAGLSKLTSPYWGSGRALFRILDCDTYGPADVRRRLFFRFTTLRHVENTTIVLEVSSPLVLFLPAPLLVPAIVIALIFHLSVGAVMGLNMFVFTYLASLPSIFVSANFITGLIG